MGRPRVFEHAFKVAPKDIDRLGHVNNVVYLRYAQDAAVAHWNSVVDQEHRESLVWVVRRHEIDYLKPAVESDELVAPRGSAMPAGQRWNGSSRSAATATARCWPAYGASGWRSTQRRSAPAA